MKLLFLVKFYQPFDRGGSEWSTHDLAKLLVKRGHQVTILTVNFGTFSREIRDGIQIQRIPFFIKLKNPKSKISPFWTNNLIWYIYSTIYCFLFCLRRKFDIIHVHNNEFIPSAAIVGSFLKKPTVVTFRDYQVICNLGFCLWKSNHACNLHRYLTEDFIFFINNYVLEKNPIKSPLLLLAALRSRFWQYVLFTLAKKINYKIAVSQKVAAIFKANGIRDIKVIYNVVTVDQKPSPKSGNQIVYVGRFSKGKGVHLLAKIIPSLAQKLPKVQFLFIGSGDLYHFIQLKIVKSRERSQVKFLGQVDHQKVLEIIRKAGLVVSPSLWPEPLSRVIIESALLATPVVATSAGSNQEIVKSYRCGIISDPSESNLEKSVYKAYQEREILKKIITKNLNNIKSNFSTIPVKSYERLYRASVK